MRLQDCCNFHDFRRLAERRLVRVAFAHGEQLFARALTRGEQLFVVDGRRRFVVSAEEQI